MSSENDNSGGDKSHDATPQKLQRSRDKGDVPYSPEVTAAATYAGFLIALIFAADWSVTNLKSVLSIFLQHPNKLGDLLLGEAGSGVLANIVIKIFIFLLPIFLAIAVAAFCSIIAQRALVFAPSKLKPKFSRLSIVDNAKQKYGPNGLAEFAKSTAKLVSILCILYFASRHRFLELPALSQLHASGIGAILQREIIFFSGLITAAAFLIASLDLPWRYFRHGSRLKMTHQEMKEENREAEGDPAMKSARRRRAEEIATNRMMRDVPTANVVIVNPTHFAVALRWEKGNQSAPQCVAKGVDKVAASIREVAATSGVPIRRDPPTARSIYRFVEIGQEVKREHYAAVAAAIHYAEKINKQRFRKN